VTIKQIVKGKKTWNSLDLPPGSPSASVSSAPATAVGLLTAKSSEAIGRNPDAAGAIRTNMILGAALAEGLGILSFVLGILLWTRIG
jgi:F-type H+-transporting ATPase subunit c